MPGEGMEHKLAGRTIKYTIERVRCKLALGFLGGEASLVDMGALLLVATDEALGGHDLHQFQDGGVAQFPFCGECVVNVADGGGAAVPEDVQDIEFGCGGFLRCRHGREDTTKSFVLSTNIFVDKRRAAWARKTRRGLAGGWV